MRESWEHNESESEYSTRAKTELRFIIPPPQILNSRSQNSKKIENWNSDS